MRAWRLLVFDNRENVLRPRERTREAGEFARLPMSTLRHLEGRRHQTALVVELQAIFTDRPTLLENTEVPADRASWEELQPGRNDAAVASTEYPCLTGQRAGLHLAPPSSQAATLFLDANSTQAVERFRPYHLDPIQLRRKADPHHCATGSGCGLAHKHCRLTRCAWSRLSDCQLPVHHSATGDPADFRDRSSAYI